VQNSRRFLIRLKVLIVVYAILHVVLTLIRPFYEITTFYQFVFMGSSLLIGFIAMILIAFYRKDMSFKFFLIIELSLIGIIALPYLLLFAVVINLH